jgi:hypothetical protein
VATQHSRSPGSGPVLTRYTHWAQHYNLRKPSALRLCITRLRAQPIAEFPSLLCRQQMNCDSAGGAMRTGSSRDNALGEILGAAATVTGRGGLKTQKRLCCLRSTPTFLQ